MTEDRLSAQDLENTVQPLDGDPVIGMKKGSAEIQIHHSTAKTHPLTKWGWHHQKKSGLSLKKVCGMHYTRHILKDKQKKFS